MPTPSDMILDAARDGALRERLSALRPASVTDAQVYEAMTRLVQADIGGGETIAKIHRYGLGQAGLRAGADPQYVTDAQMVNALGQVFPTSG